MTNKLAGAVGLAALAMAFVGCGDTTNSNANANANTPRTRAVRARMIRPPLAAIPAGHNEPFGRRVPCGRYFAATGSRRGLLWRISSSFSATCWENT